MIPPLEHLVLLLQASPEFKGIKTISRSYAFAHASLQASPEFKGIKTFGVGHFRVSFLLQASPEFKGIKTGDFRASIAWALQASPEFKGIKTAWARHDEGTSASSQP